MKSFVLHDQTPNIEAPVLRYHHKYTQSALYHHPPRASKKRLGVMQVQTGVYSTFLSVFCFCYPVWNMIYPIYHVLLFSIFSQLRMTSHPFIPPVASHPISNSNMPLPGSRQTRFLEQSKKILNTINLLNF